MLNTSSISAIRGAQCSARVAHGAAKGGVLGMTISLAAEGAEFGVRANACAGLIDSPATAAAVADENIRNFVFSKHLIQRPGTGQEVAWLAVYLASDESSFVTGQGYSIDGGQSTGFR